MLYILSCFFYVITFYRISLNSLNTRVSYYSYIIFKIYLTRINLFSICAVFKITPLNAIFINYMLIVYLIK